MLLALTLLAVEAAPVARPIVVEPLFCFGFGSAVLGPKLERVAQATAVYARSPDVVRIVVLGRADTAGPADYNLALSKRRAQAIAARLVALGARAELITLEPRGESDLVVPTPDKVREPLNRCGWVDMNFDPKGR